MGAPWDNIGCKMRDFDGHGFYMSSNMSQLGNINYDTPRFGSDWCVAAIDFIIDNLGDEMSFLDVGAHWGQFGMVAAKRTKGHVYCVEPEVKNFMILTLNCGIMPNMSAHHFALGEETGTASVKLSSGSGSARVMDGKDVPMFNLDALGWDIDFINLDVEGMEAEVLRGGVETIKKTSFIIVEHHNGVSGDYETILKASGFKCDIALPGQKHIFARR